MMRGPQEENRRRLSEIMAAIQEFERAIALDPSYAPAYGGLSEAYAIASDFDDSLAEKAKDAAVRGLKVDDNLPAAHFILGYQKFLREWDFEGALRELRRTLELNPSNVTAGRLSADCSVLLGDSQSAFAALRRVQQAVPDSPVTAIQFGVLLYNTRRFDELAAYADPIQHQHAGVHLVHWLSGLALEQQGKYAEATAALEKSVQMSPRDPRDYAAFIRVHRRLSNYAQDRTLV